LDHGGRFLETFQVTPVVTNETGKFHRKFFTEKFFADFFFTKHQEFTATTPALYVVG
jgi:hypothetical protein